MQAAKKRGFVEVTLNVDPSNQAARALYLAMGFEKFRNITLHWQGEAIEVESLILRLDAAEAK